MNSKNKKVMPKISVIITCYNYGKFIDEAIESVQNQTFRNHELIVIDDCSTDEFTKDKINDLRGGFIQVICLKKNVGVCEARGVGVKEADGEYLIFLDADDKLHRDCLQEMYDVIEKGQYDIVGSYNQGFYKNRIFKPKKQKYNKFKSCIQTQLVVTSLFKKTDWEKIGGFRENMRDGFEDYDFWLALIQEGAKVYIIPKILFFYREEPNRETRNSLALKKESELRGLMVKNNYKLYGWFICSLHKKLKKIASIRRRLARLVIISIIINVILLALLF